MPSELDWVNVFNRLLALIDVPNQANYFSGPRFIQQVRKVSPHHASYPQVIEIRRKEGKSTSRKDYFYDLFMAFPVAERTKLIHFILGELDDTASEGVARIRAILAGAAAGPSASVPSQGWNADRLNLCLKEIDASLAAGTEERAVTLAYTCLEGFYKAFAAKHLTDQLPSSDILKLARGIKEHLKTRYPEYPDEVLNMITQVSHAVDRARNRFSESHFEKEAAPWLAMYVRDLINTQIRLLIHFL